MASNTALVSGWSVEKLFERHGLGAFAYHGSSDRFIISSSSPYGFKLPADDHHPEWISEGKSTDRTIHSPAKLSKRYRLAS